MTKLTLAGIVAGVSLISAVATAGDKACVRSFFDYIRNSDAPVCGDENPQAAAEPAGVERGGVEEVAADKTDRVIAGVVIETMDVAGYTYAHIDNRSSKIWLATQQTKVKKGDIVQFVENEPFENFESKTLKRIFPTIYFVPELAINGVLEVAKGGGRASQSQVASEDKAEEPVAVAKPSGKAASPKSLAELFSQQKKLERAVVSVSGKVTKINNGILGKNWIHIVDKSLNGATQNLTLTTQEKFSVGQEIKVKGTIALNKDFGSGYFYTVLLEDAVSVN